MNYTHIAFDIDGTLLDTENAVLFSLREIVQKSMNRTPALDELRFALGIPGRDALNRLGIENPDYYNKLWMELFENYRDTIRVFDGIIPVLTELKARKIALGVVTSKTKKEYRDDFVPFGLADFFSTVVCAEDSTEHKPNSEPLEKYLEFCSTSAERVLYIGDTIYDFQCAQGAHVDFALALWGCKTPDAVPAETKLRKPGDILTLLG